MTNQNKNFIDCTWKSLPRSCTIHEFHILSPFPSSKTIFITFQICSIDSVFTSYFISTAFFSVMTAKWRCNTNLLMITRIADCSWLHATEKQLGWFPVDVLAVPLNRRFQFLSIEIKHSWILWLPEELSFWALFMLELISPVSLCWKSVGSTILTISSRRADLAKLWRVIPSLNMLWVGLNPVNISTRGFHNYIHHQMLMLHFPCHTLQ